MRPIAAEPMPPASRAADTGPLTFSFVSLARVAMIISFLIRLKRLADCSGFGDEGAKHAGDSGRNEGEDEEDHYGPAFANFLGKLRSIVADDEGDHVAAIGARKATCSFHSIPNSCHSAVFGLASNRNFGKVLRSVVPSGGTARYQG